MRGARAISSGATIGADPWSVRGGVEIWASFRHENRKINHTKMQKMKNVFFKTTPDSQFSVKKPLKTEKIARFCAPLHEKLYFCQFALEMQETFANLCLQYRKIAIQNCGREPMEEASGF